MPDGAIIAMERAASRQRERIRVAEHFYLVQMGAETQARLNGDGAILSFVLLPAYRQSGYLAIADAARDMAR